MRPIDDGVVYSRVGSEIAGPVIDDGNNAVYS